MAETAEHRQTTTMRFLVFTTLYPNAETPSHGVFVENRLRAYLKQYDADVRVIAPVPWFPLSHSAFGQYAAWARVPERENRHGLEVYHPRYFIAPKLGMRMSPGALERCFVKTINEVTQDSWDFDFIDAHYFYPDGVAAARVAKKLGKPIVVTARGSDVSLLPQFQSPRRMIKETAMKADAIITVAAALKDALTKLGAPEEKITVLRNGVDLETFAPMDRAAIREKRQLEGPVIASIGHLIERKGHDRVITALKDLPHATLLIAGDGPLQSALQNQAVSLGVASRVRFLGRQPHETLHEIYNAADLLVLASSREGWPNVLLEAMACGTPCVATPVWGSGEVIRKEAAGALARDRSPEAIAEAVNKVLTNPPARSETRRYAERHSWNETADGMQQLFTDLSEKQNAERRIRYEPIKISDTDSKPKLIVTVDTEEQFDWSDFQSNKHIVNGTDGVAAFQSVCNEAGASPLYLLTYPLLENPSVAAFYRSLQEQKAAHCGLHLHQWVTPPGEFSGEYFSFQKNLPQAAHKAKLHALADLFEKVFGFRANAHRAGRYGIAPADYALLASAGVQYDFSPSAAFDFSNTGGPDFSLHGNRPYFVESNDWKIATTPVCGARAIKRTRLFLSQENRSNGFLYSMQTRFPVTLPMRLSPEGASLADLQSLTRRLVADKTPVLTFTLHSTSLTPGANAYGKNAEDVERMLATTKAFLNWFRNEIGGEIISLDDLEKLYQ